MAVQDATDILFVLANLFNRARAHRAIGFSVLNAEELQFRFDSYVLRQRRVSFGCHYSIHVLCDGEPVVWRDGAYTADGPWKDGDHLSIIVNELQRRVDEAEAAEQRRRDAEQQSAEQKRRDALALAADMVRGFGGKAV